MSAVILSARPAAAAPRRYRIVRRRDPVRTERARRRRAQAAGASLLATIGTLVTAAALLVTLAPPAPIA